MKIPNSGFDNVLNKIVNDVNDRKKKKGEEEKVSAKTMTWKQVGQFFCDIVDRKGRF